MARCIVLAPDSFKGSLPASDVALAMENGLRRIWPDAEFHRIPMADGGEGTLDALLAVTGGKRFLASVSGADGRPLEAAYGVLERDGKAVAVLEAAQVVGLPLAGQTWVGDRTTLGLGELLKLCLDQGIRQFLIGVGGSSTNDGGAGVLAALGGRLLDRQGATVAPTPKGLSELDRIDFSALDSRLKDARITLMSDVTNPLCGPSGATAVFGPQKGVAPQEIAQFDTWLERYAALCDAWHGQNLSAHKGAGAAGGLGYAFQLLGADYRSGAEVVCELSGLDEVLQRADWIITGEGRSDAQTLLGKVPYVVAAHAKHFGVPVTLVSGGMDQASLPQLAEWFDGCFSIMTGPMSLQEAMQNASSLLSDILAQLASFQMRVRLDRGDA